MKRSKELRRADVEWNNLIESGRLPAESLPILVKHFGPEHVRYMFLVRNLCDDVYPEHPCYSASMFPLDGPPIAGLSRMDFLARRFVARGVGSYKLPHETRQRLARGYLADVDAQIAAVLEPADVPDPGPIVRFPEVATRVAEHLAKWGAA